MSGRLQLTLPDHVDEAPDLFNQRFGRHRPKTHTELGHSRADSPSELGQVLNGFLTTRLRLVLGIPGLVQGGRILLLSHLRLLQLGFYL
jgi:hypothetical protein